NYWFLLFEDRIHFYQIHFPGFFSGAKVTNSNVQSVFLPPVFLFECGKIKTEAVVAYCFCSTKCFVKNKNLFIRLMKKQRIAFRYGV
ncbi:MAG TPA: hypothetical protein PLG88_05280, partial [Chitinophagaceae bacterium]|nr:hypothetical protein [Chitinophagaceae bacterium]